jgi:hypothetical protein
MATDFWILGELQVLNGGVSQGVGPLKQRSLLARLIVRANQPIRTERLIEELWEQLMLALYRAGRQADALHAYSEVRMRLADDLGIEPCPALERMEQRILVHDPWLSLDTPGALSVPAAPVAAPGNLPLHRTTFIGREHELAVAGDLLAASRLLTLTGAPGVGKTPMALRLATDLGHHYPDGVFFVSLANAFEWRELEHPPPTGGHSRPPMDREDPPGGLGGSSSCVRPTGPSSSRAARPVLGRRRSRDIAAEVEVDHEEVGLDWPSVINCDGLRTVTRMSLKTYAGSVSDATMARVRSVVG